MDRIELLSSLIPKRNNCSHKGTYGTLTVIGGSEKYRGAPLLSSEAALRCGVGICRLCSIEKVIASSVARRPELICLPIIDRSGAISCEAFAFELKHLLNSNAILVGIGMTDSFDTASIVGLLLNNYAGPLVIDADGLNSIKNTAEMLQLAQKTPVITPHIGEMSRLSGLSIADINDCREEVAADFSKKYGCVTVLKDSVTVIVSPDGRKFISDVQNSALSKGGSGDVLSGIIASLLAQGLEPYDAAVCGVLLHSEAGRIASERISPEFVLPSDVIACLNDVYLKIREYSL